MGANLQGEHAELAAYVEAGLKGSYGGVTASVTSKFQHSEQRSEKRHFLKISYDISGKGLGIGGDKEKLKQLLTPEFRRALDTFDPGELFKDYGTHLIRKIRIGGRAEYFCQSSATSRMTSDEFKIAAKAKYEALGGLSGEDEEKSPGGSVGVSSSVRTVDTSKTKDVEGSSSLDTLGGSAGSAIQIRDRVGWTNWAQACEGLPALLGFEKDGLLPIWELVDNNARRAAIHEAYRRMAAKAVRPQILFATSASAPHPEARITVPDGYKLVCGGAKDNWAGEGNLLTASFPEGNNTWRASGKDHGKDSPATIAAFAIAIYDPDDFWEVDVRESRSGAAAHPFQEVVVGEGFVLVGGGAQVHYRGHGSLLFASYPKDERTWRAQSKDHDDKGDHATISAYAIGLKCNVNGVKLQSKIKKSVSYEGTRPLALVTPDSGYVMVGGGAAINFRGPGVLLYPIIPKRG